MGNCNMKPENWNLKPAFTNCSIYSNPTLNAPTDNSMQRSAATHFAAILHFKIQFRKSRSTR
jgi:hypothetical protein